MALLEPLTIADLMIKLQDKLDEGVTSHTPVELVIGAFLYPITDVKVVYSKLEERTALVITHQ